MAAASPSVAVVSLSATDSQSVTPEIKISTAMSPATAPSDAASPSVQSTSAATTNAGEVALGPRAAKTLQQQQSASGKAKKLRACNGCKMRRIKCEPVPPPGSCSRCKEKGIVCVTTPVVRKKTTGRSGKRIEEAKAIFGHADTDSPDFMGPTNTPWITPETQRGAGAGAGIAIGTSTGRPGSSSSSATLLPSVSHQDIDTRLGITELGSELVAHLLSLYQIIPQSWLPLYPRGRIVMMFDAVGRRLESLPPHAEVLAHSIIALTARLSSHPSILGPNSDAPPIEHITEDYIQQNRDLRKYGYLRESVSDKLRQKAVRMSWERGTLVQTNEESMACCFILEMLEGRKDPRKGKPYGSAFVSHLRTLLDRNGEPGAPKVMNMSLGWSALIMREALYASNFGRTSHFTAADDLLLCGQPPESIEETLLENVDAVDVRDSITLFFRPMRPYTYHVARLARECSDKVYGTYARRQPLDETYVSRFMNQIDHLHQLLNILTRRIDFVLSPMATSAHQLPKEFERERRFIMKACLETLVLAWSSLCLPLYLDLARRVTELEQQYQQLLHAHQGQQGVQASGPTPADASTLQQRSSSTAAAGTGVGSIKVVDDKRRTLERCQLLLSQMHDTTLKAARMVAASVRSAPSLAFLTHLTQEKLTSWVQILQSAPVLDKDGKGLKREEKENDLVWMLEGFKTMGWSWSDDEAFIQQLEKDVERLRSGQDERTARPATHNVSAPSAAPQPFAMQSDSTTSSAQFMSTSNPFTDSTTAHLFAAVPPTSSLDMSYAHAPASAPAPAPAPAIDFAAFLNDSSAVQNVAAAFGITDVGAAAAAMGIHDFSSAAAAFSGSGLFDVATMFPGGFPMMGAGAGFDASLGLGGHDQMSLHPPVGQQQQQQQEDALSGAGSVIEDELESDADESWMNVGA
ncbi:hypothetical protein ACM66B_007017 [Microbotryomycetes sp. NB124-2]